MSENEEGRSRSVALREYKEPVSSDAVKPFIPLGYGSVETYSTMLAQSGDMVPKHYERSPAKIAAAIYFGYEIGLLPMQALQSIAVINGKPSIYGDAALALVRGSGQMEDFEETYEGGEFFNSDGSVNKNYRAVCKVTRKGAKRPTVSEFSIGDAQMAELWNKAGPWKQYPKRMLKMRARAFALRDEFTDILRGIGIAEEVQDHEPIDITPVANNDAPPSTGEEPAKPRRGRPVGSKNRFQEPATVEGTPADTVVTESVNKDGVFEEAEVIETTAADTVQESKAEVKPAEKTAEKPAETKPEPVKAGTAKGDTIYDLVPSFDALNEEARSMLEDTHRRMGLASDNNGVRAAWYVYAPDNKPTWAPGLDKHFDAVKEFHKARVAKIKEAAPAANDENPPDTSGGELDVDMLADEIKKEIESVAKSADDVHRIIGEFTEIPMRDGLLSDADYKAKIQPIGIEALSKFA